MTGQASTLALTIADDGKGFEVDGVLQQGLGLINMHERVESVGGALEIHATVAGTRLTVTVPTHVAEPALAEMPSV